MANLKSSQKDIRRIERRTAHNRVIRSRLKTLRKKVLTAIQEGNAEQIAAAQREYASSLDKAAKTGIIHINKANRQKSTIVLSARKSQAQASA